MKITIVGSGYVGMSLGVLLAQHNEVVCLDIDPERVKRINNKKSTVHDDDIEFYLNNVNLNIRATTKIHEAYKDSSFIIIATPTDYDPATNFFDTSKIESVARDIIRINPGAVIVIKSTVPVGYTNILKERLHLEFASLLKNTELKLIFSPEFLREGCALKDNLYGLRYIEMIGIK